MSQVPNLITSETVVAYGQCRRKAFLLLRGDSGDPRHDYDEAVARRSADSLTVHLATCDHSRVHSPPCESLSAGGLIADSSGLILIQQGHRHRRRCELELVVGTYTASSADKIRLAFAGYVLGQVKGSSPETGTIITVNAGRQVVPLTPLYRNVAETLEGLRSWLDSSHIEPPPVILNEHCPTCPFRLECTRKATELDDLSLLDRMTPRLAERYHKKGIFTIKQLSYLFRPRRRRKGRSHAATFNVELQALAIRTGKIYLQEMPEISSQPIELFLDIEGDPDRSLYYLFGLYVVENQMTRYFDFWADSADEEGDALRQLCNKIAEFPKVLIYHYGGYEPKALRVLSRRHGVDLQSVTERLSNVNSFVFGKVYFPVRSNGLKALASYAGAKWTEPSASGLMSIAWRYHWEDTHDPAHKQKLLTYNQEDCEALHCLLETLRHLAETVDAGTDADFADQPKEHASEVGHQLHATFDTILRSAHAEYGRRRITVRNPRVKEQRKRGAPAGHAAYCRTTAAKAGTVVRVRPKRLCPRHNGQILELPGEMAEHTLTDLRFSKSGCRRTMTKYVGQKAYCPRCKHAYLPPAISRLAGRVFGHRLQAWTLYLRMCLRLPYRVINQTLDDLFGIGASDATLVNMLGYLSNFYEATEKNLFAQMLNGPVIHVDETRLNIQGEDKYVWVLTDGRHVVFRLTDTRETPLVRELLRDFKGVLVSDFYAGYDAMPCRQQKCLVHLIRDLNEDLWSNPYDLELEAFVQAIKELLVPILQAYEQYGAKRRHLAKFTRSVTRFYRDHINGKEYRLEALRTYQKRFVRYKDDVFRFLTEDKIPWNNNMAERAIRHLAVQRKISGTFYKRVAVQYLRMLGITQTCRFQSKSFLRFLLSEETDVDRFVDRKRKPYSERVGPVNVGIPTRTTPHYRTETLTG